MLFHLAVKVHWETIHAERRKLIQASNNKVKKSRLQKQYAPGDRVLIVLDADERRSQCKRSAPTKGPFTITRVL